MKHRTRHIVALASVSALVAVTAACGADEDTTDTNGSTGDTGSSEESGEPTPVRIMMFPGQSYRVPVMLAEQEGLFEEAGIELEIVEQPNNLQGMQGLEATESQVGIVTVGTLGQGVQAGSEGSFFCGGIDVLQTTMMAPPDSDLPSTEDGASWEEVLQSFEGKKVGIQTPVGSGLQLIFAKALAEAGVEDVTYVNLGGAPNVIQASLDNGSVDVAQVNPPGTQNMLQAGAAKPLIYMSEGPSTYRDYYGSAWVAPNSWLEEDPETAAEFCDVIGQSLELIADPAKEEAVLGIIQQETGVSAEVAELVVPTFEDFSTELPADALQTTFDAYTELGIFKPEPAMTLDNLVTDVS